ncbi:flavodoxin family protein [Hymenobacter cellulosilyticus]|uniref:NAD(P)H-dependent oxidoreductase n=1 Tax=Hymenobacter cellulosilyticus TaxID=2932248 RepID=A0A8T9Q0V9_9BACT|nr:NAD(P)H-dependent oxidoreductase [Hymenobacter cellulosilyticus]UOQ71027.1 NAD(P)H-dependent oxidoreductase [Hymenobacter cellulosilyticus]
MSLSNRQFLFLPGSTRRQGNSEQLARLAADHLPTGAEQRWLNLLDYPLPDFVDRRHGDSYPPPEGNAQVLLEATLQATDLVLAMPLYWYTMPVPTKQYLDYWSAWMRVPDLDFRARMAGKTFWAIVVSSGERAEAQPLADTLRLSANYMHMSWGGLLFGNGSRPGDILLDSKALMEAQTFFTANGPTAH